MSEVNTKDYSYPETIWLRAAEVRQGKGTGKGLDKQLEDLQEIIRDDTDDYWGEALARSFNGSKINEDTIVDDRNSGT